MRGSISVDNEAAVDIIGSPSSVGNVVATKRTRGSTSVGKEATVRKRTRGPASGKERVVKKRTRGSTSVGNEGAVEKRMRGSISVSNEGAVKNRMRGSVSIDNHGGVKTKRKRASSRKSAEDNSTADCMENAASELDLPSVLSEERDVDTGNVNKGRQKSTPRPKQINMTEGAADKYSTCTRIADCMSFARRNGTNRNKKHLNSSCSVQPLSSTMKSNRTSDEDPHSTGANYSHFCWTSSHIC